MDEHRRKSIQRKTEAIFQKAEDREKEGGNYFETGWQATLELMLLMMEEQLVENPGQLLPMQTSGDDEWDFYLDAMEKLDLPPDTGAVLITPSAFKEMKIPGFPDFEDSELAPWNRNAYSVIISDLRDHTVILQASLPGLKFAGIDIFEDGKHFADYMYNTVEECLDELSDVTWTYFRPKGDWSKQQIIQYTGNWYEKSVYGVEGPDVKFHIEYSYPDGNAVEQALSTESESPFLHFDPALKITRLFIDKFFFGYSIEDLAIKYSMSRRQVSGTYDTAKRKLFSLLEAMDSNKRLTHGWRSRSDKGKAQIPKGQRYFLLNRLFGLLPSEISKIEGVTPENVSRTISRISDMFKAGEISLVEVSEKEAREARIRLEVVRGKHRQKMRKLYDKDPEKYRAKNREARRKKALSN